MNQRREYQAVVDEQGRLVLPPELSARLGLTPGVTVHIDEVDQSWYLRRPITRLDKVYIEPTSLCNLTCRTCIRNVWDEPMGQMSAATFGRLVDGLRDFPLPLTVFFGGFGEPLFHPEIVGMVEAVKALGARAELITNGTLLTEERARHLIAAGLDMLWVSLDGATPNSYTDVRLGAQLPDVLANVERFRSLRPSAQLPAPEIGIVFVALERNFADLPELLRLARRLGATRFMVSNVLPHTPEMRREVLYAHAMSNDVYFPSPRQPDLFMPKMDAERLASPELYEAVCGQWNLNFTGVHLTSSSDRCPFIEAGATAIGWDGGLSPCLPLLHNDRSYLNGLGRYARRYIVGNVNERSLSDLWNDPAYVAFRAKVQAFEFAPCTICDGCPLSETNEEDCYGNGFPTCGGCLWAQGFVQCP
ncbi:MAG: tungsten cofactor oxidoreductase radical SAM maturase [Anaerolineae bacterium]